MSIQLQASQKFYIIFVPILTGASFLLYIWFWTFFVRRNRKLFLKKTNLSIDFINYAKDSTYRRHVAHFSLMLFAINLLELVIAYAVTYYDPDIFSNSTIYEIRNYLTTLVVLLGLIALANMLLFTLISGITSFILYKKEPISGREITFDIEKLKQFSQYNENPIKNADAASSSNSIFGSWLFFSFIIELFFWWPVIYVGFKTKNFHERIGEIPKWNVSEEKKFELIIYNLSLMANYLWYSHIFFTSKHKLAQVRGWLNIYIREAERNGFIFPTK
ncbi:hypothetical protein [Mycoplasmopsis agassizii]|uniref:hypothetical protein n=1 Tax=Mycoplasmopsis agassizii TaxID=33922 RepID=UPI00117D3BBC|nr:hypothetical protein [Mycoplasmopsis agassizii]